MWMRDAHLSRLLCKLKLESPVFVRSFSCRCVSVIWGRSRSVLRIEMGGRAGECTTRMRVLVVGEIASVWVMGVVVLVLLLLLLLLLVTVMMVLCLVRLRHVHCHAKSIMAGAI